MKKPTFIFLFSFIAHVNYTPLTQGIFSLHPFNPMKINPFTQIVNAGKNRVTPLYLHMQSQLFFNTLPEPLQPLSKNYLYFLHRILPIHFCQKYIPHIPILYINVTFMSKNYPDLKKQNQYQYMFIQLPISMENRVWLYTCLAGLLVVDVITTTVALSHGATEMNPIMDHVVHNPLYHFIIKLMFLGVVWIIANNTLKYHPKGDVAVIVSGIAVYTLPVINNLYQISGVI